MSKKNLFFLPLFIIILLFAASFSGCTAKDTEDTPRQTEASSSETEQPDADTDTGIEGGDTAPSPHRDTEKDLIMSVEGMEEAVPVRLFASAGCSIYYPQDDWWIDDAPQEDDCLCAFGPEINQDVSLSLWYQEGPLDMELLFSERGVGEEGLTVCIGDVLDREDVLLDDGTKASFYRVQGKCAYHVSAQEQINSIYLIEGASGWYAVCCSYPVETAEGWGARLYALAKTFELED